MPVGVVETDCEHGVAGECQPVAAGYQPDHAMPGSMTAGAVHDHPRRHLMLLIEQPQLAAVLFRELFGGRPKRVREARRHGGVGEIG
ncbi:hypothetical protein D9M72_641250 [compost metagenome]